MCALVYIVLSLVFTFQPDSRKWPTSRGLCLVTSRHIAKTNLKKLAWPFFCSSSYGNQRLPGRNFLLTTSAPSRHQRNTFINPPSCQEVPSACGTLALGNLRSRSRPANGGWGGGVWGKVFERLYGGSQWWQGSLFLDKSQRPIENSQTWVVMAKYSPSKWPIIIHV